jgi:hypothetical protein
VAQLDQVVRQTQRSLDGLAHGARPNSLGRAGAIFRGRSLAPRSEPPICLVVKEAFMADVVDNRYLEVALAAQASLTVFSDDDLLVLHPWREISILRPAAYLVRA